MPCANWPPAWSRSQRKGSEQLHPPPPGPSQAASVPQAAPPFRLSCHCGATTAECTEAPLFTYYCHCSSCQQLPGAAFCHNAQFFPDQVFRERLICGHHTPYRSCFGNHNTSLVFLPKGASYDTKASRRRGQGCCFLQCPFPTGRRHAFAGSRCNAAQQSDCRKSCLDLGPLLRSRRCRAARRSWCGIRSQDREFAPPAVAPASFACSARWRARTENW